MAHLENILLTRAIPDFPSSMELWHSYQFALRMTEIDFLFEKSVFCCNHYFSRCKYINFEDRSEEVTVGVMAMIEKPINWENTFTGIVY